MKLNLKIKFTLGGALFVFLASLVGVWLHHVLMTRGVEEPWDFLPSIGLVLVVLLLPFRLVLDRWVFRPLARLAQSNLQVAQGDLRAAVIPAETIPGDEIGAVMRSRNWMLAVLLRHQRQLEEEKERAQVLNQVLLSFAAGEIEEGLNLILEHVCEHLGLEGGWILLRKGEEQPLITASYNLPESVCGKEAALFGRPCRQCLEVLEPGSPKPGFSVKVCEVFLDLGEERHVLVAPLLVEGRAVGVMHFLVPEGFQLPAASDLFLENIASVIGLAVSRAQLLDDLRELNASLEEQVRERTFELRVLYELTQRIGYTLNYDELFRLLLSHLHRAISYEVAATLLVTDHLGEVSIQSTRPLAPAVEQEVRQRLLTTFERLSGQSVNRQGLTVQTLEAVDYDPSRPPLERLEAFVQVPLFVEGKPKGVLFVGSEQEGQFTEASARLLYTIVQTGAESIQRLQALLVAEQQRLESMVEHLPEGLLLLDAQGRIVLANPRARNYLAVLTGAGVGEVLTALGGRPLEAVFAPRPNGLPSEIVVEGPPRRIFEVAAQPMNAGPEAGGWVLVLREATQEREAQQRLQAQERLAAVGQLAAGIAHDFNNLLTGIIGYAELLQMRSNLSETDQERVGFIIEQGQRAAQLIRQILDFSRQSVIQRRPLDLVPFLKETFKLLERTLPENIHLTLEAEPGEYILNADPTQMQQVLTNLAVNARDAMPQGGELRFRLSRFSLQPEEQSPFPGMPPGEWIALFVSDTGTGIPPEVLPHLYEPFFTTKEPGQGTGLGLAQVYGIVKQHEGYIDVESQVGKGTTFVLYFPSLPLPEETSPEEAREETPRGHGETLLLVEDEAAVREVGQNLLEHLGYQVLTATNGRQALEVYERHQDQIALVLTDLVMPEMGGKELFYALRERNPRVKVVVLTGYPLGGESEDLLVDGIAGWLQKPLRLSPLAQIVNRTLRGESP